MEFLRTSPQMCPRDKQCSQWARKYLKYCLCSTKDGVSFSLGLISVFSWGIAEIPQILTNYKEKSAEGLSIAFLMTWVVGDFLNLFGCMLEPATLPTQYYTAMLYTITTLVLVTQAIYFGHIYPRLKLNRQTEAVEEKRQHNHEVDKEKGGSKSPRSGVALSSPIPLPTDSHAGSIERELYYKSARSLSRSHTPPVGFHMHKRRSAIEEPLLSEQVSLQSNGGNTKSMLCVVSAGAFFLGTFYLPLKQNPRIDMAPQIRNRGIVLKVGRRLLQGKGSLMPENGSTENGGIGTFLGWGMAAIYVGGRLPQICLNFRRGNVEGLNPYMFIFALIGNATYVARLHILGKEVSFDSFLQQLISFILEWSKIRPNLPWLVDAGGCVILDTFILIQFIFFHCRTRRQIKHGNSSAN